MKMKLAARAMGKKGGLARAAKLSPERKKQIAILGADARWSAKRAQVEARIFAQTSSVPGETPGGDQSTEGKPGGRKP